MDSLRALADRAALFSALRQDQLATALDELGEHRWDVDLNAGTLTFTSHEDPEKQFVARASFIASIAPGPRSMMWSWAMPQGDGGGSTDALRQYGEENGIPELTMAEVPFPEDTGDDISEWISQFAHVIGGVTAEITGRSPHYSANAGGSRAVLLLDAPLPPLTIAAAVPAIPRIISSVEIPDHRTAVWDLARLAGWQLDWVGDDFGAAQLTDGTSTSTIRFDDQARIVGIEGQLGAA